MATERVTVQVGGRTLQVSSLTKVLYPETGFTKADVIDYYVQVAPTMLGHISDRGITLRRFPNGVEANSFFEKRCPSHRPDFVDAVQGPGDRGGPVYYCRFDEVASLAWAANIAALELHAPMARYTDLETPTMVVFDLDPGPGTDISHCARIAELISETLAGIGLLGYPKTSGSKGLQVYIPLNTPHTHEHASGFALAVARVLEANYPELVVTTQAKAARQDRVLIDWSQNSRHKTTIAPYSMRGRPHPTVSTPVTWDEVADANCAESLRFETAEVLERVEAHGDLFAPTLDQRQELPPLKA